MSFDIFWKRTRKPAEKRQKTAFIFEFLSISYREIQQVSAYCPAKKKLREEILRAVPHNQAACVK
jgi:hypothetical protein